MVGKGWHFVWKAVHGHNGICSIWKLCLWQANTAASDKVNRAVGQMWLIALIVRHRSPVTSVCIGCATMATTRAGRQARQTEFVAGLSGVRSQGPGGHWRLRSTNRVRLPPVATAGARLASLRGVGQRGRMAIKWWCAD